MMKYLALAALLAACGAKEPSPQCKTARASLATALHHAVTRISTKQQTLGDVKAFEPRDPGDIIDVLNVGISRIQADDAAAMIAAESARAADAATRTPELELAARAVEHTGDLTLAKTAADSLAAHEKAVYDAAKKGAQDYLARIEALQKKAADAKPTAKGDVLENLDSIIELLSTSHDLYRLRADLSYLPDFSTSLADEARDACR